MWELYPWLISHYSSNQSDLWEIFSRKIVLGLASDLSKVVLAVPRDSPSHCELAWQVDFFVLIFIIDVTAVLLTDSHLHMSEEEKNHLIKCFPHKEKGRDVGCQFILHSFLFPLPHLNVWFTTTCQIWAVRIIF